MYEVQIRNSKNKEAAQYNFTEQSIYTTDVLIDGNLLTFNRVIKDGETYNSTKQEYVTNNEERKESKIVLKHMYRKTQENRCVLHLRTE